MGFSWPRGAYVYGGLWLAWLVGTGLCATDHLMPEPVTGALTLSLVVVAGDAFWSGSRRRWKRLALALLHGIVGSFVLTCALLGPGLIEHSRESQLGFAAQQVRMGIESYAAAHADSLPRLENLVAALEAGPRPAIAPKDWPLDPYARTKPVVIKAVPAGIPGMPLASDYAKTPVRMGLRQLPPDYLPGMLCYDQDPKSGTFVLYALGKRQGKVLIASVTSNTEGPSPLWP